MKDLAVIAAGSNLGVANTDEPFPVGKVEILYMYPMNFEEFLSGINQELVLNHLLNIKGKIDDMFHQRFFDLLKIYFITGGMPEVILQYKEKIDTPLDAFINVRTLQQQLLWHYERDFSKYSGSTNSRHIERVFKAIPLQLCNTMNKQSKKFKFKDVISKGYRSYEDLADPIQWLVKAGLALKVNVCEHPSIPIMACAKENSLKLFMFDIGLLGAMVNLNPRNIMQYDYGSYKGYFAENYILQELYSYGFNQVVTWSGRTSEIEFIVEINGHAIPVEVKSGTNTKAKSLQAYINKYDPVYALKFTGNQYGLDRKKKVYNYPLYLVSGFNMHLIKSVI
ncbi:MAG: ATPase [Candidatus Magnetoglobus multicellularis str. Araruama]|uniref:ATPase n=1 Tax=Candidatus Magnetoglobus multicellularis str. Araruama TaxID=890399 RepID=A0A1V1P8F9_9BACT|nr:MAG: ATPase [Candidatus Magnetoglobus multicellularis str. Araruama]